MTRLHRSRTRTGFHATEFTPTSVCRCQPRSYVLAHFRNEQLISVTRMHNRDKLNGDRPDCPIGPEPLDLADWHGRR